MRSLEELRSKLRNDRNESAAASEKLAAARLAASQGYPLFYPIFTEMRIVETTQVQTMAVSYDCIVGYNPQFVKATPVVELKWVWLHEAMHPYLNHPQRWVKMLGLDPTDMVAAYAIIAQTPWMQETARDWNISADAAINQKLEEMAAELGEQLPGGYVSPSSLGCPPGMTTEQIYMWIRKQRQEQDENEPPPGDCPSDQPPGDQGDDDGESQDGKNSSDGDQGDQGQPGDQGDENGGGDGGGIPGPSTAPGQGESGSSAGGLPQDWESSHRAEGMGTAENVMARLHDQVQDTARKCVEAGEGNVPGFMKADLAAEDAAKEVSWEHKLVAHCSDAAFSNNFGRGEETRYGRFSVNQFRYGGIGPDVPLVPAEVQRKPHVAVIADTSASMYGLLGYIFETLKSIQDQSDVEFSFVCCDSQAGEVRELTNIEDIKGLGEGGGGTSFIPAFDALEESGRSYSTIVYVTDGVGRAPDEQPAFCEDVVWALVGDHKRIPRNSSFAPIDWGTIIRIDQ